MSMHLSLARGSSLGITLLLAGLASAPAAAFEQPRKTDEAARAQRFLELADREAAAYELRFRTGDAKLKRHPDPVLHWSNPVLGELYGGVFLWTRNGRPEAAASIYKWYSPNTHMTHEFQSLSTGNLIAMRDGRTAWKTSRPGVEFEPVPAAPAPAESRPARLLHMRRLARRFTVTIDHRDKGKHKLRLLTQPVYRYGDGAGEWTDGALFAFVLGTDPDALLLLESRRTEDGSEAWHYAFARMNWHPLRARHNGRVVWNVPRLSRAKQYSDTEPYSKIHFKDAEDVDND